MNPSRYSSDPDAVVEMQSIGVGVEEILQYCHGLFCEQELKNLIRGLENIVQSVEAGTFGEKEENTSTHRDEVEETVS